MTREVLSFVLPLVLPTVFYFGWSWLVHRRDPFAEPFSLAEGPWFWLLVAGVALGAVGFTVLALTGGTEPGVYHAPRWEGGRIVPPRFE